MDYHLTKPVDPRTLADLLARHWPLEISEQASKIAIQASKSLCAWPR
jgi:hypothetical protein